MTGCRSVEARLIRDGGTSEISPETSPSKGRCSTSVGAGGGPLVHFWPPHRRCSNRVHGAIRHAGRIRMALQGVDGCWPLRAGQWPGRMAGNWLAVSYLLFTLFAASCATPGFQPAEAESVHVCACTYILSIPHGCMRTERLHTVAAWPVNYRGLAAMRTRLA